MGAEHSSVYQSPASSVKSSSKQRIPPLPWQHLRLTNDHLVQIYHNVTSLTNWEHRFSEEDTCSITTNTNSGRQYLDESLFREYFELCSDVSSEVFKAFDREEDGVVDWRHCLAGLTLCSKASVQEKCVLILSVVSIRARVLNSPPKNGGVVALFRVVFCSIHDNSAMQKDICHGFGLI